MKTVEVLLVEDDAGDTLLVLEAVDNSPAPVKVHLARDGEQAVLMLRERTFKADLVILDLNLPKLSGHEVLEQIHPRSLPVIVFAGSAGRSSVQRALELGAREFVQKPAEIEAYKEAVRRIVEKWGPWNRNEVLSVTT